MTAPSVCVLGLGLMGRPMARVLADAGCDVRGWNRTHSQDHGEIRLCASLQEAAEADVELLMLANSAAVDEVLAGLEPHLAPGRVVLDMGSSEPWRSRAHAERLAAGGVGWVDAPVSGGPEKAGSGTLAIMAGGEEGHVERVRPLLEILGGNVVRVGGPGAGHTMKIVNQVIVGLAFEAVAEGLALAEKAGLTGGLVQQALRGGSADSPILQVQGTRMADRSYVPGARVTTLLKDLRMAERLADSVGLELPHVSSAAALFQQLVDRGDGGLDCTAIFSLRLPDGR